MLRRRQRPERPHRGADRRPRRARDLLFVFGTLPAVLMPIVVAIAAILNTFRLVWALTYVDQRLGDRAVPGRPGRARRGDRLLAAHDLPLPRGDPPRADAERRVVETMTHAGRSVIVSGSTVAIGLLSMILLPLPFIRSIGIGGMLDSRPSRWSARSRLCRRCSAARPPHRQPARDPEADRRRAIRARPASGTAGRDRRPRRPLPVLLVGLADRRLLLIPAFQLNPCEAQAKDLPGKRRRVRRPRRAHRRRHLGGRDQAVRRPRRERARRAATIVAQSSQTEGIAGAAAPPARLAQGRPRAGRGVPEHRRRRRKARSERSRRQNTGQRRPRAGPRRDATLGGGARPRSATSSTRSTATSRTCSPS